MIRVIGVLLLVALFACSDDKENGDDAKVVDSGSDTAPEDAANDTAVDGAEPDGSSDSSTDTSVDVVVDAPADVTPIDAAFDGLPPDFVTPDFFYPDGFNPANLPACNGKIYDCADGIDNDGDGLIDAQDFECTGPCDNSEDSFELDIPGVNSSICKQDCYWDDDSGSGNDHCEWSHKCDQKSPGAIFSPPCPYDQSYVDSGKCTAQQIPECLDFCVPITPNGCDCFGCCEIYTPAGKYSETVYLGSGGNCSAANPQNCAACTQVVECSNSCGVCELCLGKTLADLPASCWSTPQPDAGVSDGPVGDAPVSDGPISDAPISDAPVEQDGGVIILPIQCDDGADPCLDNSYCETGYYCVTGCCQHFLG